MAEKTKLSITHAVDDLSLVGDGRGHDLSTERERDHERRKERGIRRENQGEFLWFKDDVSQREDMDNPPSVKETQGMQ
jgi:hypothetical protein